MSIKNIVKKFSKETGWSQKKTRVFIEDIFSFIQSDLKKNNLISLHGFGLFQMKQRSEKTITHPITKLKHKIMASKKPHFKASKKLNNEINKEDH